MSLMSQSVVWVSLGVTVVSILVGALVVGRRASVLSRIASVLVVAVSVVLALSTVGLAANLKMGWAKTTHDLVGLASGTGKPTAPPVVVSPHPTTTQAASPSSMPSAPTATKLPDSVAVHPGDPSWVTPFTRDPATGVWRGTVAGHAAQGMNQSVTVWAPPDYSPTSTTTYNVVVFVHGFPGSDNGVIDALNVSGNISSLMEAGTLKPTIFVVPDISLNGRQPDCVDLEGAPPVETFITKDLISSIRTNFPNVSDLRDDWVMSGISSGAYCGPILYMRHQDTFFGAISMSGFDSPQLGGLAAADPATKNQFTISSMMAGSVAHPLHLWFSTTSDDPDALALAANATAAAQPGDDIFTTNDPAGGHTWGTWSKEFGPALSWWASGSAASEAKDLAAAQDKAHAAQEAQNEVNDDVADAAGQSGAQSGATGHALAAGKSLFGLTGWGTMLVSVVASLGLLVLTVGVGPRLSGKGGAGVGGYVMRVVLVVLTVGVAAAGVLIFANAEGGFFSSWADLVANWRTVI